MVAWPPFCAENISVPESLNASEFAAAVRTDGKDQTAYRGWPLYYYFEAVGLALEFSPFEPNFEKY